MRCTYGIRLLFVHYHRNSRQTNPLCLIDFPLLRHPLPTPVRVAKRPDTQLMQHAQLLKDVEIAKPLGLLIVPERVRLVRRLRIVLAAGVLVKVLMGQATMGRDEFQHRQADV